MRKQKESQKYMWTSTDWIQKWGINLEEVHWDDFDIEREWMKTELHNKYTEGEWIGWEEGGDSESCDWMRLMKSWR